MKTQQEQDREVGEMYIARAEGKTIQIMVLSVFGSGMGENHWRTVDGVINYGCRIKPETLIEAVNTAIQDETSMVYISGYHDGAKFGTNWQKENG